MAKPIAYAARPEKGSDEHKRFTEAQIEACKTRRNVGKRKVRKD